MGGRRRGRLTLDRLLLALLGRLLQPLLLLCTTLLLGLQLTLSLKSLLFARSLLRSVLLTASLELSLSLLLQLLLDPGAVLGGTFDANLTRRRRRSFAGGSRRR